MHQLTVTDWWWSFRTFAKRPFLALDRDHIWAFLEKRSEIIRGKWPIVSETMQIKKNTTDLATNNW